MKKLVVIVASMAFTMLVAANAFGKSTDALVARAGLQTLPSKTKGINFTLEAVNVSGGTVSLSSYAGKVVLLNFFATWCGPCRSEMPDIEKVYAKFKNQGLVVLAVDLQEGPAAVKRYAHELGLTFPIALDQSGRIGVTYGARGIPTSYLIDRSGDVVAGTIGAHTWNDASTRALIKAMLAQ